MISSVLKRSLPLVALSLGATLSGCYDVDVTINGEEGVPLADLDMSGSAPDEILVTSGDKVIVTEGDTFDISVEGDEDTVNSLRFVRDGDSIGVTREESWSDKGTAIIRITMAIPSEVTIGGSGEIETPGLASNADANIGGSGTIRIGNLDAEELDISIGGNGEVIAAGSVKNLDITIGGSGTVNFADVMADNVDVSIGGSGDIALQSNGTVDASIGGSGDINVVGSATCNLSSFGSGTLNCTPAENGASTPSVDAESAASESETGEE